MSYVFYNPNPSKKLVGDCVIRSISRSIGQSWEATFVDLAMYALKMHDMPSSNNVWGAYLRDRGYRKYPIPDTCPDCYSVRDFCYDNPYGDYIVATGTHVINVRDGNYYDTWDSGDEVPIFYWKRSKT